MECLFLSRSCSDRAEDNDQLWLLCLPCYDSDYDLNGKMNSKELNSKGEPYKSHQVMSPLGSFVSCHKMGIMLANVQNSFLKKHHMWEQTAQTTEYKYPRWSMHHYALSSKEHTARWSIFSYSKQSVSGGEGVGGGGRTATSCQDSTAASCTSFSSSLLQSSHPQVIFPENHRKQKPCLNWPVKSFLAVWYVQKIMWTFSSSLTELP